LFHQRAQNLAECHRQELLAVPLSVRGFDATQGARVCRKAAARVPGPLSARRPGAGSVIAADHVARQPADGYTLLAGSTSMASARFVMAKVPYDLYKDFTFIAPAFTIPLSLLIHSGVGAKTPQELVAMLKVPPGKMQYGSYGTGAANHVRKARELYFDPAGGDGTALQQWMRVAEKDYQDALDAGFITKPT